MQLTELNKLWSHVVEKKSRFKDLKRLQTKPCFSQITANICIRGIAQNFHSVSATAGLSQGKEEPLCR